MISRRRQRQKMFRVEKVKPDDQIGLNWTLTRLSDKASRISQSSASQWSFSHPAQDLHLLPNQSARISTGWELTDLPLGTICNFLPNSSLFSKGLQVLPRTFDASHLGSEITLNIYNCSESPQKIDDGWDLGSILLSIGSTIAPYIISLLATEGINEKKKK